MAWETRNGREYFYRKTRQGDQVISEYIGAGSGAEAIATLLKLEQLEREDWRYERAEIDLVDSQIAEAGALARALTEASLLANGWHHYQRTWRQWKKAHKDVTTTDKALDLTPAEIRRIVKACDKENPKKADIAKFRQVLAVGDTWRIAGDVSYFTCKAIIENGAGHSYAIRASLSKGLEHVKNDLGYKEASTLEKMLIDQVGIAWLRHNWLEYLYQAKQNESMTIDKHLYWDRKLAQSQRRFLRAVETLAKIRKMAKRTPEILQVNIAAQQVNQVAS